MLASLKKVLKWESKSTESKNKQPSFLLAVFLSILEDVLLWKNKWISFSFIFLLNVFFFVCIHLELNFLELFFCTCATIVSIDAFETWLKFKHRTACLKRLGKTNNKPEIFIMTTNTNNWIRRNWLEYVYLRETNHTKAFILLNIFFSIFFLIGKYMSGYIFFYALCMAMCIAHLVLPRVLKCIKKIQQHADSDGEFEGLIPEVTEVDIKILSIESDPPVIDDRQSLDYWKPDDMALEDGSDSSEHSSLLVTNIPMEKLQTLDKDVYTTDSSEDEYIPLDQQKDQLQSTLEVIQPANSWSSSAFNALYSVTGAVANMVYSGQEESKRKRVSSIDSSDGFEMIDKNDLS